MIKTRIASTAALFTFGIAALGGTALVVAAPGNADTGASSSTSSSSTSGAPTHTKHYYTTDQAIRQAIIDDAHMGDKGYEALERTPLNRG